MTKIEYINRVKQNLLSLSEEEREDAIQYLQEYFEEAGVENEKQVMEELGAPAKYAAQIKAESAIRTSNNSNKTYKSQTNSNLKTGLMIAGGIFALPIALPLLLVIIALLFTVAILIFTLVFVAVVIAVACMITAIPLLFTSFGMFTVSFGDGLVSLGSSLALIGLSILVVLGFSMFFSRFIPWFINVMARLFHKLKGGKKDEEEK